MHSDVWVVISCSEDVHLCNITQTTSMGSEILTLGIHHDTLYIHSLFCLFVYQLVLFTFI